LAPVQYSLPVGNILIFIEDIAFPPLHIFVHNALIHARLSLWHRRTCIADVPTRLLIAVQTADGLSIPPKGNLRAVTHLQYASQKSTNCVSKHYAGDTHGFNYCLRSCFKQSVISLRIPK